MPERKGNLFNELFHHAGVVEQGGQEADRLPPPLPTFLRILLIFNWFGDLWGTGMTKSPKTPKFGVGLGTELLKGLGILWGRGKLKVRGILGEKSPKKPKFRGGDGNRALEMFGDAPGMG